MGVGDRSLENRYKSEDVVEMLGLIAEETHRIAVEIEPLVEISPPNWAYHVSNMVQMLDAVAEQMGTQYKTLVALQRSEQKDLSTRSYRQLLGTATTSMYTVVTALSLAMGEVMDDELASFHQQAEDLAVALSQRLAKIVDKTEY